MLFINNLIAFLIDCSFGFKWLSLNRMQDKLQNFLIGFNSGFIDVSVLFLWKLFTKPYVKLVLGKSGEPKVEIEGRA